MGITVLDGQKLNPLEVLLVQEYYDKQGITNYTMALGNDCIWCWRGQINEYFVFRNGQIVDVQVD